MKLLSQYRIGPGITELGSLRCLRVQSLDGGTITGIFDGEEITLAEGDVFELPLGMMFQRVDIRGSADAEAVILSGIASLAGGAGGASGQMMTGDGAPTSNPPDTNSAATYWDRTGAMLYNWDTSAQAWV